MPKQLLIAFALWLLRKLGYSWGIPILFIERAVSLVEAQEVSSSASGEAKRHQVYARLIKDFPQAKKSELALAIELAVRKCL